MLLCWIINLKVPLFIYKYIKFWLLWQKVKLGTKTPPFGGLLRFYYKYITNYPILQDLEKKYLLYLFVAAGKFLRFHLLPVLRSSRLPATHQTRYLHLFYLLGSSFCNYYLNASGLAPFLTLPYLHNGQSLTSAEFQLILHLLHFVYFIFDFF